MTKTGKRGLVILLILAVLLAALATGCQSQGGKPGEAKADEGLETIRVAKQFGLVYAPLIMAQKQDFFSKYGLKVEWITLGSGGTVREAMVGNEIDVAFMGIPPFMIGWDKGVPAKVAAGFCVIPVSLVSYDPDIRTVKDFEPEDKIAVPSPGSIQHILLAMALKRELGNANALDDNLVALPHPDGASAMLAKKDVVAHFTTPPYLFQELEQPGYHLVLDGSEAFGDDFNFNVTVVTENYHDKNPRGYAAFVQGLSDAMAWINENKQEAAQILAPEFNLDPAKVYDYITADGVNYTTAPYGLMGFSEFMKEAGYISKVPEDLSEIAWENVTALVGKGEGRASKLEDAQWAK